MANTQIKHNFGQPKTQKQKTVVLVLNIYPQKKFKKKDRAKALNCSHDGGHI